MREGGSNLVHRHNPSEVERDDLKSISQTPISYGVIRGEMLDHISSLT
jgi:hypothetical protein